MDERGAIGHASGFIATAGGTNFLVTNRHVVTGLDNFTRRSLDKNSHRRPTSLLWSTQGRDGTSHDREVGLYDADLSPIWLEHKLYGVAADIVAIPLGAESAMDLHLARPVGTSSMSSTETSSARS